MKSHIGFRILYLHLTLACYKGQNLGHANFDCEYLVNGDRQDKSCCCQYIGIRLFAFDCYIYLWHFLILNVKVKVICNSTQKFIKVSHAAYCHITASMLLFPVSKIFEAIWGFLIVIYNFFGIWSGVSSKTYFYDPSCILVYFIYLPSIVSEVDLEPVSPRHFLIRYAFSEFYWSLTTLSENKISALLTLQMLIFERLASYEIVWLNSTSRKNKMVTFG